MVRAGQSARKMSTLLIQRDATTTDQGTALTADRRRVVIVDQGEHLRATVTTPMWRPRAAMIRARPTASWVVRVGLVTACSGSALCGVTPPPLFRSDQHVHEQFPQLDVNIDGNFVDVQGALHENLFWSQCCSRSPATEAIRTLCRARRRRPTDQRSGHNCAQTAPKPTSAHPRSDGLREIGRSN